MLFIENKYSRIYNKIVARAQSRVNPKDTYTEKHHIIPKSLGGSNKEENLVRLTAREHYLCHLLLIKMTTGTSRTKMRYAAYMFSKRNPNQEKRKKITAREYQYLKEQMSIANKERPGPNLGRTFPEETRAKVSASLKGRKLGPQAPEHRAKVGRYERTDAQRKLISEMRKAQKGKQTRSTETKAKMSAWQKGVPKPTVCCVHCKKETSVTMNIRWHGDNCKKKL